MKTKQEKKEINEEKIQEKYIEYQMIEEQLKKLYEQREMFQKQIDELENLLAAIKDIENIKPGAELFVPLSSGIFVKAEIKETKQVLVNVGDNVVIPKTIPDTALLLKKQQGEISLYKERIQQNIGMLVLHQQKVEAELYEFVKEKEKEKEK